MVYSQTLLGVHLSRISARDIAYSRISVEHLATLLICQMSSVVHQICLRACTVHEVTRPKVDKIGSLGPALAYSGGQRLHS